MKLTFTAYTDGACSGNGTVKAMAGAAAILVARNENQEIIKEREIMRPVPGG